MALADTAKLVVNLSLAGNFASSLGKAGKSLDTFDGKVSRTASRGYRAGQQIGTGIKNGAKIAAVGLGILASQVALGLRSLVELEQAQAQTGAVLKSTGQAAGITGAEVTRLSEKFEGLNATIGDEFIRAGQNMLLTFTNIKGKAFEPALAAVLDLNTAMGKGPEGLTKTAILVGKALNDPTKGLTALTRVGVAFDKEQVKRIKGLQKEGKLYEAQQIILKELGKEFGGSFAAQGDTAAGKVAKFNDSIEDLQRSLATALLPAVGNVADALTELLADPAIQKGVADLGQEIGKLFSKDNIKAGAKALGDAFTAIKNAAPAIKAALGTVGAVLKGAFAAFSSLPAPIQQLLLGGAIANKLTGGLVTNIAGGIFGALKAMTVQAGVVNVTGGIVNGGGLPGAAAGVGAGTILAAGAIAAAAAAAVAIVGIDQSNKNSAIATGIKTGLDASIAGKTLPELKTALAGVNQGITDITANPLNALVSGDALTSLKSMQASLKAQLARKEGASGNDREDRNKPVSTSINTKEDRIHPAVLAVPSKITELAAEQRRQGSTSSAKLSAATLAAQETKRETTRGATLVAAGTTAIVSSFSTGSASIVSAIYANRPVLNVNATTVTKSVVVANRYGPPAGSRQRDAREFG